MSKEYVLSEKLYSEVRDNLLLVKEAQQLRPKLAELEKDHELLKAVVDLVEDGYIDPMDVTRKYAEYRRANKSPEAIKKAYYEGSSIFGEFEEDWESSNRKTGSPEEKFQRSLNTIINQE